MARSSYCKKFIKKLRSTSPHIKIRKLKHGFYRVYFQNAYLMEFFEEMPLRGYTFEDYDPRMESQSYFEELDDHYDLVRNLKNFKEGYVDSLKNLAKRLYLFKHNSEFNERTRKIYAQAVIK